MKTIFKLVTDNDQTVVKREPKSSPLPASTVAEEAIYWLISAPALVYIVYLTVGL